MTINMSFETIVSMLETCYQCGTCAASCPVFRANNTKNPRKFIQEVLIKAQDALKDDNIWMCTTCYRCEERCPQGIPLTTLFFALKNLSVKMGWVPPSVKKEWETVKQFGFTAPPSQSILKRREKMGLPTLPKPDLTEIQTLMDLTHKEEEMPSGE